ncbi:transposase [Streptomyces sp. NPDC005480]|uniref:transposase n=1 Tax=Streptomyces sp. NPDC005480 TaxID=3154880 RepID=UPI0033B37C9B
MCRAHQHAAGASKQGAYRRNRRAECWPGPVITGWTLTRRVHRQAARGTKLHVAVEQGQRPMPITVTAGQRGNSPQFEPVLENSRVPRIGSGRPRVRPDRVRADRAYSFRKNRAYPRRRGIHCTIPYKADQARNRRKLSPAAADRRVSARWITASAMRSSVGSTDVKGTGQ